MHTWGGIWNLSLFFYLIFIYLAVSGLWHSMWHLLCGRWLSRPAKCGILVPWPGIEPTFPALEGGFLTIGLPGKSPEFAFIGHKKRMFQEKWNLMFSESNPVSSPLNRLNLLLVSATNILILNNSFILLPLFKTLSYNKNTKNFHLSSVLLLQMLTFCHIYPDFLCLLLFSESFESKMQTWGSWVWIGLPRSKVSPLHNHGTKIKPRKSASHNTIITYRPYSGLAI